MKNLKDYFINLYKGKNAEGTWHEPFEVYKFYKDNIKPFRYLDNNRPCGELPVPLVNQGYTPYPSHKYNIFNYEIYSNEIIELKYQANIFLRNIAFPYQPKNSFYSYDWVSLDVLTTLTLNVKSSAAVQITSKQVVNWSISLAYDPMIQKVGIIFYLFGG